MTPTAHADSSPPPTRVFHARGLTKVYGMGEARVHALAGVDLDLFDGELVVLLGRPAAARPPS